MTGTRQGECRPRKARPVPGILHMVHGGLVLAILLVFAGQWAWARPAFQVGGEWEAGLDALQTGEEWSTMFQSLLRLKLRAGVYLWRFYADVTASLNGDLEGGSEWQTGTELERLYLKLYFPHMDVSLGKQQVNWGVGYAWAPTDVFNPPDPTDPSGRRPGVSSLVITIPVGTLSYWSLVAARGDDNVGLTGTGDRWRYGVRRHGNVNGTDWSVLAMDNGKTIIAGADAKGDLGIGWHAEVACFVPRDGASAWFEGVLGGDYSWDNGRLIWLGEYFYNSAGAAARDAYDYPKWLSGEDKHLARHYIFNQLTYRCDEFSSLSGSVLANLVDHSAAWTLGTHTLLADRWQLSFSATVLTGDEGSEFAGGTIPRTTVSRPGAILKVRVGYVF